MILLTLMSPLFRNAAEGGWGANERRCRVSRERLCLSGCPLDQDAWGSSVEGSVQGIKIHSGPFPKCQFVYHSGLGLLIPSAGLGPDEAGIAHGGEGCAGPRLTCLDSTPAVLCAPDPAPQGAVVGPARGTSTLTAVEPIP